MEEPRFDLDEVFDEDYLYFYGQSLTEERDEREAELVARLVDLRPGMRVLDLACGHGRIANRLARAGAAVVGVDRSPLFLERARKDAAAMGVDVDYREGDMRALGFDGEFDAVVLWFTAFGYFSDEANRRVLEGIARALAPGGAFRIELNNREMVLQRFQAYGIIERDGDFMIDVNRYDPHSGRTENERIVLRDGRVRRMHFGVRMLTFPELRTWLAEAGFSAVEGFDDQGAPYAVTSRRMVVRARRP